MTTRSPGSDEPLGTAETGRFAPTDLAERVERATASRFFLLRAIARLALTAEAQVLPLVRLRRKLASGLRVFAASPSPVAPAALRRALLAVSATLMAAGASIGSGILPGPAAMDLAGRSSAFELADGSAAAHAAAFHPGHASGGQLPTTPPPGIDVARLAPPLPGTAPSTTAPPGTLPPPPANRYVNPLAQITNIQPKRIDQGVDYSGAGPLLALSSGTIRMTSESGWPGGAFIALQLDSGLFAGQVVYYAENITPAVTVGQHVSAGDVVGTLHDAYPNLEIGWGGGGRGGGKLGDTLARSNGEPGGNIEGMSAAVGVNFNGLLVFLGAPSGIAQGLIGHLPFG